MDVTSLSIAPIATALRSKEFSSVELTQAYLDRISKLDSNIHAYLTLTADQALAQAATIDRHLSQGRELSPLAGVPMAVKDIFCTAGVRATCGSKILENYIAPYTATSVQRLFDAGSIMLGKVNMDEFACGSSTETSAYGLTKNPWDAERVPGGSSGGSAAAVAADLATFALGTDTGGSIRQPASLCGIVGLKPTYGRVSRSGVIAMASSLDQVGPMTKTVADAALVLQAMAGNDPLDATSVSQPVPDYTQSFTGDLKGLKIGVPKEYFAQGLEPEIEKTVRAALAKLEDLGATLVDVSLSYSPYALAVYYVLMPSELSANLARFDGVRYGVSAQANDLLQNYLQTRAKGFGPEIRRRIMLGTYALSSGYYDAYYLQAQKVRTLVKQDFDQAFNQVDVIATPTSPVVAFKFGEKTADPLTMYLSDVFTVSANIAGIPGLSLPCGLAKPLAGGPDLPVGLQLLGKQFDEATVLRAGHAYEQATDWYARRPVLAA